MFFRSEEGFEILTVRLCKNRSAVVKYHAYSLFEVQYHMESTEGRLIALFGRAHGLKCARPVNCDTYCDIPYMKII